MKTVIGIKFKYASKIYYYDPLNNVIPKGTFVIIESIRGLEYTEVVLSNMLLEESKIVEPLKPILRLATAEDKQQYNQNVEKAKEAYEIISKKIVASKLCMRLSYVEYTFDRLKLLIYFSADNRVDFRELVKELASIFHTRIELRQINEKEEFKMKGAISYCGQECCCSRGLAESKTNMKMAKTQGLSMNPVKLAGMCGKIMCCLAYENEHYASVNRVCPKIGTCCDCMDGRKGKVLAINHMKETIKLRHEDSDIVECFEIPIEQIIKDGILEDNLELEV